MGCVAEVAEPPACRAGAPLRRALGSESSLCTYSRVLPRLQRSSVQALLSESPFGHPKHMTPTNH